MKKSYTVIVSLWVIGVWIVLSVSRIVPASLNDAEGFLAILFWAVLFAAIRLFALYWQTLIHAIQYVPRHNRVAWIIGHFIFGILASIPYYFIMQESRLHSSKSDWRIVSSNRHLE